MAPKRAKSQPSEPKSGPATSTRSKRAKTGATAENGSKALDPPKSGISLSSQSYSFTGPLANLPFELLVLILKSLASDGWQGGKAVILLFSTCKALYTLASTSADAPSLFHDLYRKVVSYNPYLLVNHNFYHPIYSPKWTKKTKGSAISPVRTSVHATLPLDAIFDWRSQFCKLVVFLEGRHCLMCLRSAKEEPMSEFSIWHARFCSRCVAKNVVVKSNVDRWHLTLGDLGGLVTTTSRISSIIGNGRDTKQVDLYCGMHLEVLSLQKHGIAKAQRSKKLEKKDSEAARLTILRTYFLLHCGIFVDIYNLNRAHDICPEDVDPGWFATEYWHVLERKGYRKTKSTSGTPSYVNKHGTPYPTKLRSVEAFITDHHEKIVPHLHRYVEKREDGSSEPFYRPAPRPGPIIPQPNRLAAYEIVEQAVSDGLRNGGLPGIGRSCPVKLVGPMQSYVLEPSTANMDKVMKVLEEEKQKHEATQSKSDLEKTVALPSAPVAGSTNIAPNPKGEGTAPPDKQNDRTSSEKGKQKDAEGPEADFVPSNEQIAFEKDIVEKQARWMKVSEEQARKARMERVNQAVRAVSVAKLTPNTFSLDLEKLKWSLVYDKNEKPCSAATAPHPAVITQPAFGAPYVNALTKTDMEKERKLMLKAIYIQTSASRARRVDKALPSKYSLFSESWAAVSADTLSGRYLAYLDCGARGGLEKREKIALKDVVSDMQSLIADCVADLINMTGVQVAENARKNCPYSASTPFCLHKPEFYCWLRHLDPTTHPNPYLYMEWDPVEYYDEMLSEYGSDFEGFGLFD